MLICALAMLTGRLLPVCRSVYLLLTHSVSGLSVECSLLTKPTPSMAKEEAMTLVKKLSKRYSSSVLTRIVLQISQRKITLLFLLRQSMSKANKQNQNRQDEHL